MKLFSSMLFDELAAKAAASPRGRAHYNVHISSADPVQRFFVAAGRQSYFRPHRHQTRSETGLILRGTFDILTFDDSGNVLTRQTFGAISENLGYETPRGAWHTLIAQEDGAVFFEVKEGPYDQTTAAEFAPWAPPEGDALVPQFLARLRGATPGTNLRA